MPLPKTASSLKYPVYDIRNLQLTQTFTIKRLTDKGVRRIERGTGYFFLTHLANQLGARYPAPQKRLFIL